MTTATTLAMRALVLAAFAFSTACSSDGIDDAPGVPPPGGYAAAGEVAFYETLNGVAPRDQEAVDWLTAATGEAPQVGRPWFLLGMMHLWRVAQAWTDPAHPGRFVQEESVLGPAGEHPIRLRGSFGYEIVDQHSDIGIGPLELKR